MVDGGMGDGGWWVEAPHVLCKKKEDIVDVQEGGREWEGCGRQPMAEVASFGLASRGARSAAFTATERKETGPEPVPETEPEPKQYQKQ